jgi:hypothetical protein
MKVFRSAHSNIEMSYWGWINGWISLGMTKERAIDKFNTWKARGSLIEVQYA